MKRNLPPPQDFLGQQIPGHPGYTIRELRGSGCNAHVFVAHAPDLARDIACKVIPKANLVGVDESPPTWRQEIEKANRVPSNRVVKFHAIGEWDAAGTPCIFLLSEVVRGVSLREYVKKNSVDVGFVASFLGEMFDFLRELCELGLQHGDFHAGNILVEDRSSSFLPPPYAFRITDFGVASAASEAHLLDDFEQLATMLRELLECVDYQAASAEDRYVFDWLSRDLLGKALLERDTTHDVRARHPRALFESLQTARKSYRAQGIGQPKKTLATPFDYLSCEQIGESHALLKELYSDKMLGLPALEDRNNLVVTGPRGCGKTTVFRSLSLRHRHYTDDDEPSSLRYLGVYYRCDDLYFSFPRYKLPEQERGIDIPIHFLTATLIIELLEVLSLWLAKRFPSEWSDSEAGAAAALWSTLGLQKPSHPAVNSFDALRRALEKERARAARKQRFINDPAHPFREYFGPDMLPRVCGILAEHFSGLHDRPVYFLVDDYSNPKVNILLQKNLNRLVMQRSPACFFKLATESPSSFSRDDIDGKSYVESREFRMLNLGIDFIHADRGDKLRFVDDVFGRRFEYTAGYPIETLEALIGTDPADISYNEVARGIRSKSYPVVWGRDALAELCSGDVHFIIELVGKMVAAAGGPDELDRRQVPAVPAAVQNKTIREEAGKFLRNLRALPTGPALVEVVQAFGAVAGSYLRYRDSKNEAATPPHQASRIEPFEDPHLDEAAQQVYDDLLRYSVFIEDVRGKSRRGSFVPRLYLRRFLLPFFNLTFSKRDSIELSVEEFHLLLLSPKVFAQRKRLKEPPDDSSTEQLTPDPQMPLFPTSPENLARKRNDKPPSS